MYLDFLLTPQFYVLVFLQVMAQGSRLLPSWDDIISIHGLCESPVKIKQMKEVTMDSYPTQPEVTSIIAA